MENNAKVSYWACWWRATWVLFLASCVRAGISERRRSWFGLLRRGRPHRLPDLRSLLGLDLLADQEMKR